MRYLVAINESKQAFDALRGLQHLASLERGIILHALEIPLTAYPGLIPEVSGELYRIAERDVREEGEHLLHRAASMLPAGLGPAEGRLEVGTPAQVIISTAEREHIDLILMGARGLSPLKEIVLGSVSHRVVTHAPCAVLTVPSPLKAFRKVLLAIEGPEDARIAIRFFMHNPFQQPVDVDVLTVPPLPQGRWSQHSDSERLKEMALQSAHRFVEDIAGRLSTMKHTAMPIVKVGLPAEMILHHIEELQPDLIVIGSHAGTSLSRFALGSVSHRILHSVRRPVLTLR